MNLKMSAGDSIAAVILNRATSGGQRARQPSSSRVGSSRASAASGRTYERQQAPARSHRVKSPKSARLPALLLLLLATVALCCAGQGAGEPADSPSATTTTTSSTSVADEANAAGGHSQQSNSTHKLKPVNFTLVDQIFESVLADEDEVVRRWRHMDAQLQDGMKSILKMLFPQIVAISQDAKVSGECSGGILKWILSLRNLRSWAIKMLDATGKPSAGVFEGSLTMFGNYRQCLSVRAPDEDEIEITDQFEEYFRGQFCVIHLRPWMPAKRPFYHVNSTIESLVRKSYKYYEKTLYDELAEIAIAFNFVDIRMDLCVPSTCTIADIQRVAELLSKKLEMRAKVMRCDIAPREPVWSRQLDASAWLWLPIPLALFGLSLLVGLTGLCCSHAEGDQSAYMDDSNDLETEQTDGRRRPEGFRRRLRCVLVCLSPIAILRNRLACPSQGNGQQRASNLADHHSATLDDLSSLDECNYLEQQSSAELKSANNTAVAALKSPSKSPMRHQQHQQQLNLEKPLPLYGLRNLFVFWFILVQMTVELKYQYLRESLGLRQMIISYWPFQLIVNSVLLFDSLILITAFTFSYTQIESTLRDLVGYIVDKFVRLLLPIGTLVALTIWTPLMGIESPVWRNFVDQQSETCKSTGYLNLFFLQNFIAYDKICLPHTWLFCVEMQLVVLSLPLVLLFKSVFTGAEDLLINRSSERNPRGGPLTTGYLLRLSLVGLLKSKAGLLTFALILAGVGINFFAVYTNQLPPSWFYTFPDPEQKNYYFGLYLTRTWTHLSVFLIGLLGGHLCRSAIQLRQLDQARVRTGSASASDHSSASQQHPSPAPSSAQAHGSTSTIMAMELSSGRTDDSSSTGGASAASSGCRRSARGDGHTSGAGQSGCLRVSLQLAALVCMASIIFSTFSWSTQEAPSTLIAATYDASSRVVWSVALVGLMMQLCLPNQLAGEHQYSPVARLLSHPVCTLLGRLSFLAYLISPYINNFVLAVEEQSLFPSLFIIFHVIVGNIVITYVVAFALAIVIEQPVRRLVSRFVLGNRFRQREINVSTYCVQNRTNKSLAGISVPSKLN